MVSTWPITFQNKVLLPPCMLMDRWSHVEIPQQEVAVPVCVNIYAIYRRYREMTPHLQLSQTTTPSYAGEILRMAATIQVSLRSCERYATSRRQVPRSQPSGKTWQWSRGGALTVEATHLMLTHCCDRLLRFTPAIVPLRLFVLMAVLLHGVITALEVSFLMLGNMKKSRPCKEISLVLQLCYRTTVLLRARGHVQTTDEAEMRLSQPFRCIAATAHAFAGLTEQGRIVAWGVPEYGGDASSVQLRESDGGSGTGSNLCRLCRYHRAWYDPHLGRWGAWWRLSRFEHLFSVIYRMFFFDICSHWKQI